MTNEGAADVGRLATAAAAVPLMLRRCCYGRYMGRSASGVGGETHLCPHQRSHSERGEEKKRKTLSGRGRITRSPPNQPEKPLREKTAASSIRPKTSA
ncbi:Hypothetical predicted protein [Xyrichtys novacula]|uniref:Uncharacterized protein n=1 Tax=Xyrichtys novacula TaxID=13765 RepID=A0AAV1HNX2_XYRNO|nr:Hypothetical predicted protein [Xyrichtys novacula]